MKAQQALPLVVASFHPNCSAWLLLLSPFLLIQVLNDYQCHSPFHSLRFSSVFSFLLLFAALPFLSLTVVCHPSACSPFIHLFHSHSSFFLFYKFLMIINVTARSILSHLCLLLLLAAPCSFSDCPLSSISLLSFHSFISFSFFFFFLLPAAEANPRDQGLPPDGTPQGCQV